MTTKSKATIREIANALTGRGRLSHSPLYWWMWDHFDQLQKERQGRADWISATEEFAKLGFSGRDKTPLKRDNVRKTWERVVRDRKARGRKPAPASSTAAAITTRERQPGALSPLLTPSPVSTEARPPDLDPRPRERKRMVLRSPVPLAEGETAPNDGSRLPAPLRPEIKP
jgi:hypothetical protein